MAQFETVASLISDAAVELGLGEPSTPVFESTDANIAQMLRLLKRVGRGLVKRHPWLQQRKEYTLVTDGSTSYDLPADFASMVDQTGWNRSSTAPMEAVTSQVWQYLKALPSSSVIKVVFRTAFDGLGAPTLEVQDSLGSGQTLAFEYRSRLWVIHADDATAPDADAPTADEDKVLLDSELVTACLKVAFLQAKGFDSSAAVAEAFEALESERSANVGAMPVLRFGRYSAGEPLMDERNAPRTGFGFDAGGLF